VPGILHNTLPVIWQNLIMSFIASIHCQVPSNEYPQEEVLELFRPLMQIDKDRKFSLLFRQFKKNSGIKKRYSVMPISTLSSGKITSYTTAERQKIYEEAAELVIKQLCTGLRFNNISNVITVSCTGYQTPGIDFRLIDELGLSENVQRYHIGAMGCYAGIVALRLASKLPGNTLVLCLEFCSIHFQSELSFSSLSSNSLFGDGAALVELNESIGNWRPLSFHSERIPNTLDKMNWLLRDTGFVMGLSPEVPQIIQSNILQVVQKWLSQNNLNITEIQHWVIHPGGAAILNAVQDSLSLSDIDMQLSQSILYDYGNMSSATVFFILKKLKAQPKAKIVMMAFGPGLTVELALLENTHA
jgi:predicted naringenin-chalcone synthase